MTDIWRPVDGFQRVWTGHYDIGAGAVNALVVGLDDDALMLVSAPNSPELLAGVDALGRVTVIVAPNPNHRLGVAAAAERWPDAEIFAPAARIERVAEKCPPGRPPKPVEALVLPDRVDVHVPDGMKSPDLVLRVRGEGGVLWYVADMVTNLSRLPLNPLLAAAVWVMGFRAGVRPNGFGLRWLLVADKHAFVRSLKQAFVHLPPTVFVPGHGRTITDADVIAGLPDRIAAALRV